MNKRKIGRPRKFESVEEFIDKAEQYFNDCETNNEPLTITGLCIALGTTRDVLMDYQNKQEYSNTIKYYKQIIENAYEKRLINRGNSGDIFALKNFGWQDKQEIVQTTNNKADLSGLTTEQIQELLKEEKW